MLTIFLVSCSKKNKTTDNQIETTSDIHLVELNEKQVSEIISPKQNDTIYVTNFFATWCGPCMHEIPYFKEKMEELRNDKVKFTFVNLDRPQSWSTAVKNFAIQSGLEKNIILFNTQNLSNDFFSKNFKTWNGGAIPFTIITKGNHIDEKVGMMSKEELSHKISTLK